MTRALNAVYIAFNTACMLVFAYQAYLWIRVGTWTRIPTHAVLPAWKGDNRLLSQWQVAAGAIEWVLNVELGYTLGVVATVFYVAKLVRQRKTSVTG